MHCFADLCVYCDAASRRQAARGLVRSSLNGSPHPPPPSRAPGTSASFPTFLTHSTAEILGHLFQNSHSPPDPEQRDAWSASVDLLKPLLATPHRLPSPRIQHPPHGPARRRRAAAARLHRHPRVQGRGEAGNPLRTQPGVGVTRSTPRTSTNPATPCPSSPCWCPRDGRRMNCRRATSHPTVSAHPLQSASTCCPSCWTNSSANSPPSSTLTPGSPVATSPPPRSSRPPGTSTPITAWPTSSRTEADERNLSDTARRVEALIQQAQANNQKIICFVTGVPRRRQDAGGAEHRHVAPREDQHPRRVPVGATDRWWPCCARR